MIALGLLLAFFTLLLSAQDSSEGLSFNDKVIYGKDDRLDYYERVKEFGADDVFARIGRQSIVSLMFSSILGEADSNGVYHPSSSNLREAYGLCSDQRFGEQRIDSECSGTLVDSTHVVTAGHCILNMNECSNIRFVFNYYITGYTDNAPEYEVIRTSDVYSCADFVTVYDGNLDWAYVTLDREVLPSSGHFPIPMESQRVPRTIGERIVMIGFPSGLPMKIEDGGRVVDSRSGTMDYFQATADAFGGNSGSGIFNADGTKMIGILVRGETDYVIRGNCTVVNELPDQGFFGGEHITYSFHAHPECMQDSDCNNGQICESNSCVGVVRNTYILKQEELICDDAYSEIITTSMDVCVIACASDPACDEFSVHVDHENLDQPGEIRCRIGECNTQSYYSTSNLYELEYCDRSVRTDGIWYGPLDLPGHGRTVATPEQCRQRCLDLPDCFYFNNFPNGGCHVAGQHATLVQNVQNPTVASGAVRCANTPEPSNIPSIAPTAFITTPFVDECVDGPAIEDPQNPGTMKTCAEAFAGVQEMGMNSCPQPLADLCPVTCGTCPDSPTGFAFQLRGHMGQESVTINYNHMESVEIVLSQEWMDFVAFGPIVMINFNRDTAGRVAFRSNFERIIIYEGDHSWNCMSENEDWRCMSVRDGRLAWGGAYLIMFGEEITDLPNCESKVVLWSKEEDNRCSNQYSESTSEIACSTEGNYLRFCNIDAPYCAGYSPFRQWGTCVKTTANPTLEPTFMPTANPSDMPSVSPTSSEPTAKPSIPPSVSPTNDHTASPTSGPTTSPTSNPSQIPSSSPVTSKPTTSPTSAPSDSPTTNKPSNTPSMSPTHKGFEGSLCNADEECDSFRCNVGEFPYRCREKVPHTKECQKHSDCESDKCLDGKCVDGRNNDKCNSNDDCQSGRCAFGVPFGKCQHQLEYGSSCIRNNDCTSGHCLLFTCTDNRDGAHCVNDDDCLEGSSCAWGVNGGKCKKNNGCTFWSWEECSEQCTWFEKMTNTCY